MMKMNTGAPRKTSPKSPRTQTGSSLLEALISAFVLAFGILGIAGTQTNALRSNQGALEQSTVVLLSHSMFDAMRASMQPADAASDDMRLVVLPGYDTTGKGAGGDGFICEASEVTGSDLAAQDLKRWVTSLNSGLNLEECENPACGKITCDSADKNLCTITVRWNNSRAKGGENMQTVENRSRL